MSNIRSVGAAESCVNPELEKITSKITDLPVLPDIGIKIIRSLNDDSINLEKVTEIIRGDPIISTKLLKTANSVYYSTKYPVTTIQQAVNMLGLDNVRSSVMSLGFLEMTHFRKSDPNHLLGKIFWNHSIATAHTAQTLAKKLHFQMVGLGEAYLAGLIHDIGIYLLLQNLPEEYGLVLEKVKEEQRSLLEVEKEVLKVTHVEMGAWLVKQWELPPVLLEVVESHHGLGKLDIAPELCVVVHLADLICRNKKIGFEEGSSLEPIHPKALDFLEPHFPGAKKEEIYSLLLESMTDNFEELEELLGSFYHSESDKKEEDKTKEPEIEKPKIEKPKTTAIIERETSPQFYHFLFPGGLQFFKHSSTFGMILALVSIISIYMVLSGATGDDTNGIFLLGIAGIVGSYLVGLIEYYK